MKSLRSSLSYRTYLRSHILLDMKRRKTAIIGFIPVQTLEFILRKSLYFSQKISKFQNCSKRHYRALSGQKPMCLHTVIKKFRAKKGKQIGGECSTFRESGEKERDTRYFDMS